MKTLQNIQIELAPSLQLSWSFDEVGLNPYSTPSAFYYAAARFIRLSQVLQKFQVPILAVDVDALVRRSLLPVLSDLKSYDIGIYLRLDQKVSRRKVLASALIINSTKNGLRYVKETAISVARALEARPHDHIDQMILYYLWRLHQLFRRSTRWKCLGQELADWECRPDSLIWSFKGNRKQALKAYIDSDPALLSSEMESE